MCRTGQCNDYSGIGLAKRNSTAPSRHAEHQVPPQLVVGLHFVRCFPSAFNLVMAAPYGDALSVLIAPACTQDFMDFRACPGTVWRLGYCALGKDRNQSYRLVIYCPVEICPSPFYCYAGFIRSSTITRRAKNCAFSHGPL